MVAIHLDHLKKEYSNGRGIHGLSLQVEKGEIFGFLGPNGAGKSTTIRTLLGMLTPDGGRATVMGHDIVTDSVAVRRETGYLSSENTLFLNMTGQENLRFSLDLRRHKSEARAKELAALLGVDLRVRLRNLSHGQRQKVAIVVALAHSPSMIIMDEPTTGLDPLVQDVFFALLRQEQAAGKTIFMSSHVLSEVEELCERIAIIRDGNLVEVNRIEALRQNRVKRLAISFRGTPPDISGWPGVSEIEPDKDRIRFAYLGPINQLINALAGQDVMDLTVNDPSLEEVFLAFYGRNGKGGR